jgi:SAM-dependent methyltransferase
MARELKNILVNSIHDRHLLQCLRAYASGRLIDIGCGIKPYSGLARPFTTEHIGLDHEGSIHRKDKVDLVGTAYSIPAPPDSFDTALCTAVLEHLEEPESAIRECHRVLKPGGIAIYSVPFIWHLHEEPRDFFRFSKYGLRYLFEKSGFQILELKSLAGFWVTFGQLFVYYLYRFNRAPLKWIGIIPALGLVIQAVAFLLDRIDKADTWTWMYMIVAQKKKSSEEKVAF